MLKIIVKIKITIKSTVLNEASVNMGVVIKYASKPINNIHNLNNKPAAPTYPNVFFFIRSIPQIIQVGHKKKSAIAVDDSETEIIS